MTSERKLTDFRQWVLGVLDLLGADPGRQTAYLQESGVEADEILLQFDDVLHVARARACDGSLRREDLLLIESVHESVDAVSEGPESIWAASGIEESAQWSELRTAARAARTGLDRHWDQDSAN
ncbi:hypothetical protein [Streptomyces sp. NPDC002057]|uniref:hypothetical protein n=1 Tax=Streptomyces sp. NPDC002057 TaxID=3154664 RepID=UPI0033255E93